MKSMTGYGLGKNSSSTNDFEVSLRAVNGRFLEPRFHIPREFLSLESDLKKILEKYFSRGTIDIFITRKSKPGNNQQKLFVNKNLAQAFHRELTQLAKSMKVQPPMHVETFTRLPEVFQLHESHVVTPQDEKALLLAMRQACESCQREREREGASLQKDLHKTWGSLSQIVNSIQKIREEANRALQAKWEQKLKSRLSGIEVDQNRLAQEVATQIEKSDINEELTRLSEHLKNYQLLLKETGAIGKKLDFYTQELLREVNTIGSKSSLSKLTENVVEAKTFIERLREQVQNVE